MNGILKKTAALIAASLMVVSTAVAQDKVTLRFATFLPEGDHQKAVFETFFDKVVADSEGTLDYKMFYSGSLGRSLKEQLTLVQKGIADMSVIITSYTPGSYDDYGIAEMALTDKSEAASVGLWNAFEKGLLPTPDGVKVLAIYANGENMLHLSKPVESIFDIKGRKVRAGGKVFGDTATALDAIPVSIPATTIAESISRGVIEGAMMDWGAIKAFRISEVTSYHIDFPFGALPSVVVINENSWNKLSDVAKAAFIKHGGRAFASRVGKLGDIHSDEIREEILAEGGHTIITLSEEEQAKMKVIADDVTQKWVGDSENRKAVLEAYLEGLASVK